MRGLLGWVCRLLAFRLQRCRARAARRAGASTSPHRKSVSLGAAGQRISSTCHSSRAPARPALPRPRPRRSRQAATGRGLPSSSRARPRARAPRPAPAATRARRETATRLCCAPGPTTPARHSADRPLSNLSRATARAPEPFLTLPRSSTGRFQEHCWRPAMAAAGPPPPIRASPEDRRAPAGGHPRVADRIVIEAAHPGLPAVPCEGVSCQAVQVGRNTPTWYWHCPATGARYLHLRSTQACQMGKVHLLAAASVDNGRLRYRKPFVFAALKSQSKVRAGARPGHGCSRPGDWRAAGDRPCKACLAGPPAAVPRKLLPAAVAAFERAAAPYRGSCRLRFRSA